MKNHEHQLISDVTESNDEDEIKKWYRMRWWMTMIATCQGCLVLFEYGASQTSGLYYFQNAFNVENPKLFYSLSIGINFISGIYTLRADIF